MVINELPMEITGISYGCRVWTRTSKRHLNALSEMAARLASAASACFHTSSTRYLTHMHKKHHDLKSTQKNKDHYPPARHRCHRPHRPRNQSGTLIEPCAARHGAVALVSFYSRGLYFPLNNNIFPLPSNTSSTSFYSGFQEFCSQCPARHRYFGRQLPLRPHALQPHILWRIGDYCLHAGNIWNNCCQQLPVPNVASRFLADATIHRRQLVGVRNAFRFQCFDAHRPIRPLRFSLHDLHPEDRCEPF